MANNQANFPLTPRLVVALLPAALTAAAGGVLAQGNSDILEFDEALIRFELNATDRDAGVQIFLDGEGWDKVRVVNPRGRTIFSAQGKANIRDIGGLTELFIESNEPTYGTVNDEQDNEEADFARLQEILDLFPEGEYTFSGTTVDGQSVVATAELTHDIPAGPNIVLPLASTPEECAMDIPTNAAEIAWEPVEESITGDADIDITGYQVIVEQEEPLRVFQVDLPENATMVMVPQSFLQEGTEYSFEILAKEESGNQTITESCFVTAGGEVEATQTP